MLARLITNLPKTVLTTSTVVVQIGRGGRTKDKLISQGLPVIDLGLDLAVIHPNRVPSILLIKQLPYAIFSLRTLIKQYRPALIHGWSYLANIMATMSSYTLAIRNPVLWSIFQTLPSYGVEKASLVSISRFLSKSPAAIIYNSQIAREQHERFGLSSKRSVTIPNGIDLLHFQPQPQMRHSLRADLGISDDTFVIALFARYHPMKDHAFFCRAASVLVGKVKKVRFLMAGRAIDRTNRELLQLLVSCGIDQHTTLLGEREDMPALINCVDIVTVSSKWGESFSNVVAEAMACEIPVIATDLGDIRSLTGKVGVIVRSGDVDSLVAGWLQIYSLLKADRIERCRQGRKRIEESYDITDVVESYTSLYGDIIIKP